MNLNSLPLPDLYAALRPRGILRLLELARDEDLGPSLTDLASNALAPTATTFTITARQPGTLAGLAAIPDLITIYNADITLSVRTNDGDTFTACTAIAELTGSAADLLRVERPMLNLLSRLSGVATLTAKFVEAVAGTSAEILDTRKTTPGLRALEKYAVRCGGARSHRLGLDDAAMFKDNHLANTPLNQLAETLTKAAQIARQAGASFVEVEVDTLDQLDQLLTIKPALIDYILLDNMKTNDLRSAVERRNVAKSNIQLEASGGITLESVRTIAETGVERISTGALTHSAQPIDFGLDAC